MGLIESVKLLFRVKSTVNDVEQGVAMKSSTRVIVAIVGLLTFVLQNADVQKAIASFLAVHPAVAAVIAGLGTILALIHVPVDAAKKTAQLVLVALVLGLAVSASAQTSTTAVLPVHPITGPVQQLSAPIANLYAVGGSYNVGGSPAVAGTALYAHQLSPDTAPNLYAFTAIDAVPNTLKPFTVNTNVSIGVAQRVAVIDKLPIYLPTSAGVSFNGVNTGWQWNTGATTLIRIRKDSQYYVMPTIRLVKSSVSNGSGYQPIVGLLFGWGQ